MHWRFVCTNIAALALKHVPLHGSYHFSVTQYKIRSTRTNVWHLALDCLKFQLIEKYTAALSPHESIQDSVLLHTCTFTTDHHPAECIHGLCDHTNMIEDISSSPFCLCCSLSHELNNWLHKLLKFWLAGCLQRTIWVSYHCILFTVNNSISTEKDPYDILGNKRNIVTHITDNTKYT